MRVLRDDRGAVTVEAALALCSLVAVMVMVIAAVSAASAHLRCLDAAREAARLISRGESQRAREIAAAVAPRGATVDVRVSGDEVDVRVTAAVVPGIPGLSLVGVAVAVLEPAAFLSTPAPPDGAVPPDGTASPDGLVPPEPAMPGPAPPDATPAGPAPGVAADVPGPPAAPADTPEPAGRSDPP